MSDIKVQEQQNNPLHGLKLETLLTELVEFYGWEILSTAMRFHCFQTNPSIKGSLKFLQKTEWARTKLENFYLSRFKRMPRAADHEFELLPRERGFADGIVPRKPMQLTIESIELSQAKAASAHKERSQEKRDRHRNVPTPRAQRESKKYTQKDEPIYDPSDPWGKNR